MGGTLQKTAAGDAAGAATNLFDTILALISAATGTETPTIPTPTPDQQAAVGAFFAQQIDPTAPTVVDAAPGTKAVPAIEAADPKALADLLDQLGALADSLDGSAPVDPAMKKKVEDSLEALAAILGIALPQSSTADRATAAGAATDDTDLDALTTIQAAAPTAPAVVTTTDTLPGDATAATAALDAATDATASPASTVIDPTDIPVAIEAKVELPPAVKELAEKLVKLADAIAPRTPDLAKKLEAIADQLQSGKIDSAILAQLGLDASADAPDSEIAKALDRLMSPGTDVKPMPAPSAFTAALLGIPDLGTTTRVQDAAPTEARPIAKADADPKADDKPAVEMKTTERTDKPEPAPRERNTFQAAFQASLNAQDNSSSATQQAPTAVPAVTATVAADTKAIHAAYRAPVQQINVPQIAFEISRQLEAGNSRFQIRLDPPELGKVEVKLDVDKAGNVNARMTVERSETLDLFQRDQRALERALAQAGLDSSKTNLEFSLRQNPFARDGQQQQQQGGHQPSFPIFGVPDADDSAPITPIVAYRGMASAGGVNLFV
jgi:flagellar hook-length control protein FliK